MSNTLIDKLSKMERDSIIKNDERVAQSIFNLTKKSKEKEDNNLKLIQVKGLSAPSEYQFKKLFNDLYTDITDAESAFVSGRQTQEKTYGLSILKKYNLLCQYITRVLKYNSMTQSNKDQINNVMDTALPHLNNILSVIDIGYATLSRQYGEPVFNDIPIYKNIKENIQSRIYSQISRETMKYEIDDDDGEEERYYYEDGPDVEDLDDDEGVPPQDVFLRQPPDFDYENFDYDEPERLVRDENYDGVQFEEPMELQYGNYEEPERLLFEDYEEEPQELQVEREPYPVQRYIDYDQGESFPIQYAEQNEEYDDNFEQRADKQRERNLLKKTVSELKKRAKQKLGAKENLKTVIKKLGDDYKLKPYGDDIKEKLQEEQRVRRRQTSAEYNEQKLKEKEALNKITNFLKRGIRNRKKKDIKEQEKNMTKGKFKKVSDQLLKRLENKDLKQDIKSGVILRKTNNKKNLLKDIEEGLILNEVLPSSSKISKNILNDLIKKAVNMSEMGKSNKLKKLLKEVKLKPLDLDLQNILTAEEIIRERKLDENYIKRASEGKDMEYNKLLLKEALLKSKNKKTPLKNRFKGEPREAPYINKMSEIIKQISGDNRRELNKKEEKKEPYIKGYQKKPENIKRAKELRKARESKKVKITNPNQWARFIKKWGPMARGRTLAEKTPELQRMYNRWMDGDEKYDF